MGKIMWASDLDGSREHHESFRSIIRGSEWPQHAEKGKNSKFPKLSGNDMITKRMSQDFHRQKRIIKQSYELKDIRGQSLVNLT
jgi:hypothetical protein